MKEAQVAVTISSKWLLQIMAEGQVRASGKFVNSYQHETVQLYLM